MKNIFKYTLSFLAMSALMLSCAKEEEHQPGEPEVDGCYGVYFPAQETDLVLDPAEPTTASIAVMRTVTNGNITVPVTVSDTSGRFTVSQLVFEDGQSESNIILTFDKIGVGTSYSLNFEITDPQYASKYNSNPIAIDFSVIREKWNLLGKVGFTENFMWGFSVEPDHEKAAEIYQNDNDKNLFRLENPFSKRYTNFTDGSDWLVFRILKPGDVVFPGTKAETKITKKGLVYYEDFNTGYTNTNYNDKVWLMHPGGFGAYLKDEDSWSFNKVLQYQKNGLPAGVQIAPFYYLNTVGGGWDGSQQASIVITFPGAVLTDYTIKAEAGETKDGEFPVEFTFGADVASAKYAVYEGALSTAAKQKNAEAIGDGTETSARVVPETGAVSLSFGKSGVYTLVAVSFDADGKAQENTSVEFCYVAKGDEANYKVNIGAGLELTSRYVGQGYTKINSALFYIYGKDLVDVKMGVFKTSSLADASEEDILSNLESVGDSLVNVVNKGGYSDLVTGLSALTSYTLVVWGSNGYSSDLITSEVTTDGLPKVDLGTGTYTYNFYWADEDGNPYPDKGLSFKKDPNYKNTYVIEHWGGDVDFSFTYDPATGKAKVPLTYIGDNLSSYGPVYVMEAKDCFDPAKYEGYDKLVDSYYDATTKTFNFCIAYIVAAGDLGTTVETFTLDQDVTFTSASVKAASLPQVSMKNFAFGKSLDFKKSVLKKSVNPVGCLAGLTVEREVRSADFTSRAIQAAPKSDRFDKSNIISDLRRIER